MEKFANGIEPKIPELEVQKLVKRYEVKKGIFAKKRLVHALEGVSFNLKGGQTLAIVGESGCGKSTLARQIMMIEEPTSGQVLLDGINLIDASEEEKKQARTRMQVVFQNPYASLNPRKKVQTIIGEPLIINTKMCRDERLQKTYQMMEKVGLKIEHADRYPHMFSGGQRQRIAIARALIMHPSIVVADEPVSALDVSVQAQVLNLLMDLQEEMGVAYVFISHDLSVVRHIANKVMVMYLGRPVEYGDKQVIFSNPLHPYTQALMVSTPLLDKKKRKKIVLGGEVPSPISPPKGCAFHTRCPFADEICRVERPRLTKIEGRKVACHFAEDMLSKDKGFI